MPACVCMYIYIFILYIWAMGDTPLFNRDAPLSTEVTSLWSRKLSLDGVHQLFPSSLWSYVGLQMTKIRQNQSSKIGVASFQTHAL